MTAALWEATGVQVGDQPDEEEVFQRALRETQKAAELGARREAQHLDFSCNPVCMLCAADQHLDDPGTDLGRAFYEAEQMVAIPQSFVLTAGDVINQFILEKLKSARQNHHLGLEDAWVLARRYMRTLAPKWALAVGGNHDLWAELLTGVDWMREEIGRYAPQALYDSDDCRVVLNIQGWEVPIRVRHRWRGYSIYNPTHGIERTFLWDQDFLVGVGGHTHTAGLARTFNAAGATGMAVLCGSYKRQDAYARRCGFPHANNSTAVAVIFDATTGSMTGCDNLQMAASVMHALTR